MIIVGVKVLHVKQMVPFYSWTISLIYMVSSIFCSNDFICLALFFQRMDNATKIGWIVFGNTHLWDSNIKSSYLLMLWRAEKTQDDVVGNSGQGIYWQGSDITHRPDETHRMGGGGARHMAPCRGGAPCLYCKEDIVAGKNTWGQVNPAREQMSPPWWGSSTGLKGCRRQQFPARKHLLNSLDVWL